MREQILDSYISNQCKTIQLYQISNLSNCSEINIENKINEIVRIYREELDIITKPEKILIKLAIDANYENIVQKEKSLTVKSCINLLAKSDEHLETLKNQSIVLFLGGTGSGKSSTVAYLLDANIELINSKFGEKIVQIIDEPENYPKIGHSVGTSETLYTHGYPLELNNSSIILADCPGFRDTRGTDYKFCASLSIDSTIKQASNIKAVVLVVPYTTFLLDKGKFALEEIENIIDLLPNFKTDNSLLNSILIIITKSSEYTNVEDGLKQRINEYINEISLEKDKKNQKECYLTEIFGNKLLIWRKLQSLMRMGHIKFIDIADDRKKQDIYNILENCPEIKKTQFNSSMLSYENINMFEDFITMSTHTWTTFMIPRFMQIQSEIKNLEKTNDTNENIIIQLDNQINEYNIIIENCHQYIKELNEYREKLDLYKTKSESSDYDFQLANDNENKFYENYFNYLKILQQNLNYYKDSYSITEKDHNYIKNNIEIIQNKINSYAGSISNLSEGYEKRILFEFKKISPNENLKVRSLKDNSFEIAVNELRDPQGDEILKEDLDLGEAKNYKGSIRHIVILDANYEMDTKNDTRSQKGKETLFVYEGNKFKAEIEGKNFETLGKPKENHNRMKMAWPITTHWKGNEAEIPWFKISHTFLKKEIYEAEIKNKNSELLKYLKEKQELDSELKQTFDKLKQYKNSIAYFEQTIAEETNKYNNAMDDTNYKLIITQKQNEDLQNSLKFINSENLNIKNEVEKNRIKIFSLSKILTYSALAIKCELKSFNCLYRLCSLIINNQIEGNCGINEKKLIIQNRVKEFVKMYEDISDSIQNQVEGIVSTGLI